MVKTPWLINLSWSKSWKVVINEVNGKCWISGDNFEFLKVFSKLTCHLEILCYNVFSWLSKAIYSSKVAKKGGLSKFIVAKVSPWKWGGILNELVYPVQVLGIWISC